MADHDVVEAEVLDHPDTPANVAALAVREQDTALVRPAADLTQIGDAFDAYQQLRQRILSDSDFQKVGREGRFLKRSGWRKLSTAFGVDFDITERHIDRDARSVPTYAEFVVRATAPNGRHVDGWGACSVYERCCQPGCTNRHQHCPGRDGYRQHADAWTHFSKPEHDLPATAETRAKNRAAADLFGMGEISAEEAVTGGVPDEPPLSRTAGSMTEQQRNTLFALLNEHGFGDEARRRALQKAAYGVESAKDLSELQAQDWINALRDTGRRNKMLVYTAQLVAQQRKAADATGDSDPDGYESMADRDKWSAYGDPEDEPDEVAS